MKKYILMTLSFIALSLISFAQQAEIDKQAPAFSLPDSYENKVNLSDYKGKWIVLEWVNFDCPFVKKHYSSQNIQNLQKEYMKKGVIWLSICSSAPGKQGNYDEDKINEKMLELKASPSAYLVDIKGEVGKLYGAKTTPHIFIINPKGILIYAGGIDDIKSTDIEDIPKANNYIKTVLDAVLSGKDAPVKSSTPYGCSVKY